MCMSRRHPATYPELELSHLVQSAALLGIGLVYQESCHRCSRFSLSLCCHACFNTTCSL